MSKGIEFQSEKNRESRQRWVGRILIVTIILLLACLGTLVPQWVKATKALQEIQFNLHSLQQADYSVDLRAEEISEVDLAILRDILRDLDPDARDIDSRINQIYNLLNTQVPTATPVKDQDSLATLVVKPTGQFPATPTILTTPQFSTTLTSVSVLTQTPTLTFFSTISSTTSTATYIPFILTSTPTATTKPTKKPTKTVTPNLTLTATPTPTLTFTPTPTGCLNPSVTTGFIDSIDPENASTNVPVDSVIQIQFNQSMDATSLIYGDERQLLLCKTAANNCASADRIGVTVQILNNNFTNDLVILSPLTPLSNNRTYYLTIGNRVRNACLVDQGLRYKPNFSTAP